MMWWCHPFLIVVVVVGMSKPFLRSRTHKMNITRRALVFLAVAGTAATAFSLSMSTSSSSKSSVDRRSFVGTTAGASVAALGLSGVAPVSAEEEDPYTDFTTTESGMKYKIVKEGTGAIPLPNQTVKAVRSYIGWRGNNRGTGPPNLIMRQCFGGTIVPLLLVSSRDISHLDLAT